MSATDPSNSGPSDSGPSNSGPSNSGPSNSGPSNSDPSTSDSSTTDSSTTDSLARDAALTGTVAPRAAGQAGSGLVRANLVGTVLFASVIVIGVAFRDERPAQVLVGAVSLALFSAGAVGCLWAYVSALERSRVDEIGVANLYLLTGRTSPPKVKLLMSLLLGTQVVVALGGAIIGAVGLTGSQVNALAFGILVPMFGLAMNSLWAVRHGAFGPRLDKSVQPSNRKIG